MGLQASRNGADHNADLDSLIGGSSGIGLAAAQLLLSIGAKVVVGDLQPPRDGYSHPNLSFQRTDVTVWKEQLGLFRLAKSKYGYIDHVFANAGVSFTANYLSTELDEVGDLREPSWKCQDINLRGCTNTTTLALFFMRPDQGGRGGSIVITASVASFTHYRGVEYTSSKHGALGLMRGMHALLNSAGIPIRVNAISPSWTATGLVPEELLSQLGVKAQPAEDAARSALILMADDQRNGQLLHSALGKIREVEESILVPAALEIVGTEGPSEDEVLGRAMNLVAERQA